MTKFSELYDRDFVLWTEQQAAALRDAQSLPLARTGGTNLALDWENLAEEIESLGKSDRRALRSQTRRILRRLFKLEASPAAGPRAGWRETVGEARAEIEDVLHDSPSLRREVDNLIAEEAAAAAKMAAEDLRQYGEPADAVRDRLERRGFTAEQVLGDWFPDAPG
jgi:hypothetical protein